MERISVPFFIVMARFQHLIFDLDGTLVDTRADLAAAANVMLKSFGLPPQSVDQVSAHIGQGAHVLVERVLGPEHAHLAAAGFAVFMHSYAQHLIDQSVVYPGIPRVLTTVQACDIVLSVLTNKPEAASRGLLSGLGLLPFFTALVGGDTLLSTKPDPSGVWYLQRVTEVPLGRTLLIGDSSIDMQTGRAAGIAICGVGWGFGAEGLAEYTPEFVVHSAEDLLTILEG